MEKDLHWDGVAISKVYDEIEVRTRHEFADDAKHGRWDAIVATLEERPELINATRLDSGSRYTALHQAAYLGAPSHTVHTRLQAGAWRTLLNRRGERPIVVAVRRNNQNLVQLLEPVLQRSVPLGILHVIRKNFHNVIHGRIKEIDNAQDLLLPELDPLLEYDSVKIYLPVPGMYGGFSYWLETDGVDANLGELVSSCRRVRTTTQDHFCRLGPDR